MQLPPLSLYIHMPMCVKKCPYCDFNSHQINNNFNEDEYIKSLILDLKNDLTYIQNRRIKTIFIGGGTPSLFSAKSIYNLLSNINNITNLDNKAEITLEANPGTFEIIKFKEYAKAGINRLSIGVQSFNNKHLNTLQRIHNKDEAIKACNLASELFNNINIDLMFGLPNQTIKDALNDLTNTFKFNIKHLSWYQLTIEPNTYFYNYPPPLPNDDFLFNMQQAGFNLLNKNNLKQYEISAYSVQNYESKHNLNYWQFGDYLGIGAGAHGKITLENGEIWRLAKKKNPKVYLNNKLNFYSSKFKIKNKDLPFEFLLNALRLINGVNKELFIKRTNLNLDVINNAYNKAIKLELLQDHPTKIITTNKGKLFLNDLLQLFLID